MSKLIKLMLCLFFLCFVTRKCFAQQHGKQKIDSLLKLLDENLPDTNRVNILFKLNSVLSVNNPDKAMQYVEEGYKLASKIGYKRGMMLCVNDIASIQLDIGKYDEAIKNQDRALALAEEIKDRSIITGSYTNLGAIYQRMSKYKEAATFFFKALKKAEEVKDNRLIALSETNIAAMYIQQGNFEKARYYALKADYLFQRTNFKSNEAKNLEMLGNSYAFDGKGELSKPYYQKALRLYQQTDDELGKAVIYTQMVDLYSNNPIKQINYLENAKNIWDRIAPNNLNAIANLGNYGFVYFEILKDPKKLALVEKELKLNKERIMADAENYFAKSIALSEKAGVNELIFQLTLPYSQLGEYKKDYKLALYNLKKHIKLQDSIYSQEIKNKIASLDSERQIAIRDKELQLSKLKFKQLWLYGILILVILSSVILFLYNKYRIRQLRFKNTLQQQQAAQLNTELSYQNQLSESELKAIRSQMNPHFIFNVLNSIESYIMDNDKKVASRLIQKFAALSRLILENSTKSMVTADREWKAIKLYTELEAMRYDHAFTYTFRVDEAVELKDFLLPPMLIQPLIENAILHGLIESPQPDAHLDVALNFETEHICITVIDNGVGYQKNTKSLLPKGIKEKSIGLQSILERVEMINRQHDGFKASFQIRLGDNYRGTIATICLPVVKAEC